MRVRDLTALSWKRRTSAVAPLAGTLTTRQARLVDAVVQGTADTVAEAGRQAGYSHRETTSHALRLPNVQREIERRRHEKTDSARSIRRRAISRLSPAVDAEDDAIRLSQVAVAMATVEEKIGEEEQPQLSPDRDGLRKLARSAYLAGFRHALEGKTTKAAREAFPELAIPPACDSSHSQP